MAKHGATALNVILGGAILYLAAHAVTGRQGLVAYVDLPAPERVLEDRIVTIEAERARLEARAARLRPESLDLDYLDERARITLAAAEADEMVFALEQP